MISFMILKKQLITLIFLSIGVLLLLTDCTVVKRKYTKGFYVSSKSKTQRQNATVRETEDAKIGKTEKIYQPAQHVITKPVTSPPAYASASNKTVKASLSKKLVLPPDSCNDIITFMDGKELQVKIEEISPDYIAYRRCDYLNGPLIKSTPSELFRIKYANGMIRVFSHEQKTPAQNTQGTRPAYYTPVPKTNGWAIAAFVSSLLSFLLVPAFLAVIFGIVSLVQFENEPAKYKGKWMAIFGLVLGGIVSAILVLSLFL
jgi:hypothetical protein